MITVWLQRAESYLKAVLSWIRRRQSVLYVEANYISLQSWGMHRKQNVQIPVHVLFFGGLKVIKQFRLYLLSYYSSPLLSLSSPNFYLLLGIYSVVGFILVGNVLRNVSRILRLNGRKGTCTNRWEVKQDFHGNSQVNVTRLFASFWGLLDWIVLILVSFFLILHNLQT